MILAQVKNINPGLWAGDGNGVNGIHDADGFANLSGQHRCAWLNQLRRLPGVIIKARLIPAGHFHPRIIFLTIILVVGADGSGGGQLPIPVANHL